MRWKLFVCMYVNCRRNRKVENGGWGSKWRVVYLFYPQTISWFRRTILWTWTCFLYKWLNILEFSLQKYASTYFGIRGCNKTLTKKRGFSIEKLENVQGVVILDQVKKNARAGIPKLNRRVEGWGEEQGKGRV